jgi:hypothetical protein
MSLDAPVPEVVVEVLEVLEPPSEPEEADAA